MEQRRLYSIEFGNNPGQYVGAFDSEFRAHWYGQSEQGDLGYRVFWYAAA